MHPLTKLIIEHIRSGEMGKLSEQIDKIIVDYLTSRAEWLIERDRTMTQEAFRKIVMDSFELSPSKTEWCICYASKVLPDGFGGCQNCGRKIKPSPKLPEPLKIPGCMPGDVAEKINEIIDYLKSRE